MNTAEYIESGIVETYVFGLTSAAETAEVEQLMLHDAAVKHAVNAFAEAIEQEALINRVEPPPGLKKKIMSKLQFQDMDKADDDKVPFLFIPHQKRYTFSVMQLTYWKNVAAAFIILFTASLMLNIYFFKGSKEESARYESLYNAHNSLVKNMNASLIKLNLLNETVRAINDSTYLPVKMPGVNGKEGYLAIVYWNRQTKEVYLLKEKLPVTVPGKQYQLWAIVNGKPVDAGLISDNDSLSKMKEIPDAQAFAITLEKAGGSNVPDLKQLYVMGNI